MPESQVELYSDLQDKLSQADAATKSFTTSQDPAVKKYRFQLQKAVTMTVNSISANSGEDLRDKISRLQRLLRGDTIEAVGRPLSIRNHPAAKMYSCNLLAKKLVVSYKRLKLNDVDVSIYRFISLFICFIRCKISP